MDSWSLPSFPSLSLLRRSKSITIRAPIREPCAADGRQTAAKACEPGFPIRRDHLCTGIQSSTQQEWLARSAIHNCELLWSVAVQGCRPPAVNNGHFSRAQLFPRDRCCSSARGSRPPGGNGTQLCEQLGGMRVQGRQPLCDAYGTVVHVWHSCCSVRASMGVIIDRSGWSQHAHTTRSTRTREFRARSSITRPCARPSRASSGLAAATYHHCSSRDFEQVTMALSYLSISREVRWQDDGAGRPPRM